MTRSKILITGATGFIGANTARFFLEKGHEIFLMVHNSDKLWRIEDIKDKVKIYTANISDKKLVEKIVLEIQPNYVFHLAHYGGNKGETSHDLIRQTIIEGTVALYEACSKLSSLKAIINTGSSSEYGSQTEAMNEKMLVAPNTEYGLAKVWTTLYGQYLAQTKGFPVVTVRLFSVFGPYEAPNRLISRSIIRCLTGKDLELADPKTVRDFIYIEDVLDAFQTLIENPQIGKVFNIGTGVQTSLEEVARLIIKLTDAGVSVKWGSFPNQTFDTATWKADTSYAETTIPWKANHSFESGILKTIEWFKSHIHIYEK